MKLHFFLLSFVIIVFLSTCVRDDPNYIDPEFDTYVDMFFEEAQKRDLNISPDDFSFSVVFGDDFRTGVCYMRQNRIEINEANWGNLTELTRQYLIFHEMGHCILDRLHDNEVLPNGECKSLMKGDEENECRFNIDNFNIWRTYYLDELFNSDTALPNWYTSEISLNLGEIIFEIEDSLGTSITIDLGEMDPEADIHFEAIFKGWDKSNRATFSIDNERILCANNAVTISNMRNLPRYFKKNVDFSTDTKVNLIRKDGFFYYLVDDQMLHMEDQLDTPLSLLRLQMEAGTTPIISETLFSLKVALLD